MRLVCWWKNIFSKNSNFWGFFKLIGFVIHLFRGWVNTKYNIFLSIDSLLSLLQDMLPKCFYFHAFIFFNPSTQGYSSDQRRGKCWRRRSTCIWEWNYTEDSEKCEDENKSQLATEGSILTTKGNFYISLLMSREGLEIFYIKTTKNLEQFYGTACQRVTESYFSPWVFNISMKGHRISVTYSQIM
jgi:hypothetical protein